MAAALYYIIYFIKSCNVFVVRVRYRKIPVGQVIKLPVQVQLSFGEIESAAAVAYITDVLKVGLIHSQYVVKLVEVVAAQLSGAMGELQAPLPGNLAHAAIGLVANVVG